MFLLLGIFVVSVNRCRPKMLVAASAKKIYGLVTTTSPYCGGARPTDAVVEEMNRPKPYSGKIIYISRSGEKPDRVTAIKAVTNDTGYFFIDLGPGRYSFYQEEQLLQIDFSSLDKPGMVEADTTCLRIWKTTPLAEITVADTVGAPLKFNFHRPCFISGDIPCQNYVGPMPP